MKEDTSHIKNRMTFTGHLYSITKSGVTVVYIYILRPASSMNSVLIFLTLSTAKYRNITKSYLDQ